MRLSACRWWPLSKKAASAPSVFLIAVGIWTVWVAASSFMAGGYLTGRLRRRIPDATEDEAATRDGAHGLVVWGVGALLGALLLAFTTVTTAQTAAITGAHAAGATVEAGSDALATADIEGLADSLMRSDRTGAGTTSASQEASRLLAGDKDMSDDDRQYLVSLVTRTTGLDAEQAEARVNTTLQQLQNLRQDAEEAAETARRASILSAFLLAVSLLIGAAGAYWAAGVGGRHRDDNTVIKNFGLWR